MSDTTTRLAGLSDEDLKGLHERLDAIELADSAIIEAHHLAAAEMLKRGIPHGHTDDQWSRAVVLTESATVSSPDDIEAPEGFEKAWGRALQHGGTISVLLTVDGYVLKADPTVSDVHEDTIMGGGRKKPRRIIPPADMEKTIREEDGKFVVYSEDLKRKFGTYETRDQAEARLRQIERFAKAESYAIPREVQSAARRALRWISDGMAGDGFTSVGRERAAQLADGGEVSHATLVKMRAYFARHGKQRGDHARLDDGEPTPWRVAWDAWGGDAGRSWVNSVLGSVEKRATPEAVTDLHVNTKNRQHAIDEYLYGPLNPEAPGNYWERLGDVWGVSAGEAATTRCGNCAAFNVKSEMKQEIADAISGAGSEIVDAGELGYCELLEFKCAASRACAIWLTGGPIADDAGDDEYDMSLPAGEVEKHLPGKHDQKEHGRWSGSGDLDPAVAQSIIERVRDQGGLTVSMVDGSEPPDGYMVARTEGVKPAIAEASDFYDSERGPEVLGSFLKENKQQLTGGDYLGLWHDTDSGKVFLDVAQNVKDRGTAERLGSERDQISIWDVVEGQEIPTGGTGEIAKADSSDQTAGSVEDDGRGDRRLRGGTMGQTEPSVAKHGQPGQDREYHRKHPEGRSPAGMTDGNIYQTRDHKRAISMLSRGEKVILESTEDANTFLETMHEFASEAREKGEDAGDLDLCRVSVPGTNLFCGDSLGVERIDMPQLAGKPVKGSAADKMPKDKNGEVNVGDLFREQLEGSGVDVRDMDVPAAKLKASQNELKGANVGFMMSPEGQKVVNLEDTRIFVSSDGYVIDGHHRWAANVGLDANDGSLGDKQMKATVIDLPISEVLPLANEFADEIGIAPKAAKSRADEQGSIADKATLVSKSIDERMFTLGPLYIPNATDAHAEWTDPDELQKAVWDYVKKGDRRIRLQHDRDIVAGEWLEIMAWPYDVEAPIMLKDATESTMTFPANTVFLGVQWEPWAWQMIKEGKLRGYSIGGHAQRLLADLPEEYVGKAQASFEDAVRIEAEDVAAPAIEGLEDRIATAVAEAMKSINPVVNVVMPEDKPKIRRVERDNDGNIARIIEEE